MTWRTHAWERIFAAEDLAYEFQAFDVLEITRQAEGFVLAIWVRKP